MITDLVVSTDARTLLVTCDEGDSYHITAVSLRQQAMDSASRRERIKNGEISVIPGIQITALTPMGSTGINIQFSDGHKKAVFPYSYLRKIAAGADN